MTSLALLLALSAPLPYPRPAPWTTPGTYEYHLGGVPYATVVLCKGGEADFVYAGERGGRPFTCLRWELDRQNNLSLYESVTPCDWCPTGKYYRLVYFARLAPSGYQFIKKR